MRIPYVVVQALLELDGVEFIDYTANVHHRLLKPAKETTKYWIHCKTIKSLEGLQELVDKVTECIGVNLQKDLSYHSKAVKLEHENVKVWIPVRTKTADKRIALYSEFFDCKIERKVHITPEKRDITYSCELKK